MNHQERQSAVTHLAANRERMLRLLAGLSEAQWRFHPGEGRWSIGDCVEHVARVENRFLAMIQKKIAEEPGVAPSHATREKDSLLMSLGPDRTNRRQAPEPARPMGQWTASSELVAEFENARARSARFVAETSADLRAWTNAHPFFGELDCYQWVLLMGLHAERHARQIEEIKADAAFPA